MTKRLIVVLFAACAALGARGGDDLYCVIDLTGGPNATAYPVSYLSEIPSGGWTDEYKTSKLVLRKIPAGSFMMGGTVETTISKPFHIGIFEVTQRQWELVMGTRPSYFNNTTYYATRPVEQISYSMIRGSVDGAGWPTSAAVDGDSFLGKIQARTGLGLDLPTEAQWEYACRAGTTSMYNNGGVLDVLGRYFGNGGSGGYTGEIYRDFTTEYGTAAVGSYLPNAWELYDMHGNVWELCLDWAVNGLAGGADPKGRATGSYRIKRGGCWNSTEGFGECASDYRSDLGPTIEHFGTGFRLAGAMSDVAISPEIRNVTAKQRYPWDGLVDITCEVSGIDGTTNGLKFAVAAVDADSGTTNKVLHFWVEQDGTNSTDYAVHTNGDYRFVWDAQADLGQVIHSNMVVRVTLIDAHGKVQLWEGGPYWATTNIGAEQPEDYGYYFWWGDTVGYTNTGSGWISVKDGTSISFTDSGTAASTYGKDNSALLSAGYIDSTGNLVPEHDAAHVHWGGNWRMPTADELSVLNGNCDWSWTTTNGVNGYVVRGREDYASASIFLPCAGYGVGTSLDHAGSDGACWSSVLYSGYYYGAWYLYFTSGDHDLRPNGRVGGQSVRPVQGFIEAVVPMELAGDSAPFLLDTVTSAACGDGLYCVVDLAGGPSATFYPVSYLADVPPGGWTDEYKTTKLVLRKILAGTFSMSGTLPVTISKPFYIGIFEVTQKQYELVTGRNPSQFTNALYYATRPVERVSYNDIRGSSLGVGWPKSSAVDGDSFLGKIRSRTGLNLDLPTEAQWEYACRAGTTSDYNNGKNRTGQDPDVNLNEVGRYKFNGGYDNVTAPSRDCTTVNGTAAVGSYLPNAWELYDMHGNVWEWCLNWYGTSLSGGADPLGPEHGSSRVVRGGGWYESASDCMSWHRSSSDPSGTDYDSGGFRLCCSAEIPSAISTAEVVLATDSMVYSGVACEPDVVSVTIGGTALTVGGDYQVSYADNVNAGMASITLTGTNFYNGTYTTNFTIRPKPLTQGMVEAIGNHPYTGKAQTPKPMVTDAERGVTLREDVDYTLSYANNTAIGEGIVTVTGMGNYTGSIARAFVIEPSAGSELEESLGGAGKVESDGAGGWIMTLTNDVDSADLPIEIPDDFGPVKIDLNGHNLVGADGEPAIRIVSGGGEGSPTVLTVITTGGDAVVQGGEGAPAVEVADGTQEGAAFNFGEGVIVRSGVKPEIRNVTAMTRYPWNGLVDITCTVSGIDGTSDGLRFALTVVDTDFGITNVVSHFWVVKGGTNSTDYAVHANGDYRLVWDARAEFGTVIYGNMVVRVTLEKEDVHHKVQLWENGPCWATTNIGADKRWESGYYFWWGDTVGYEEENAQWVATDGSSSNFLFCETNTPTYSKTIATLKSEGWITADEILAPEHDAAHVHWGGSWRMPTKQELDDLNSKCDWTWTTVNNAQGYVIKGKGVYASASIFLPCAGYVGRGSSCVSFYGSYAYYWSSVPNSHSYYAWCLDFVKGSHGTRVCGRFAGHSVRPVQGFTEAEVGQGGESAPFLLDTLTFGALDELPVTIESDGEGGRKVTITNDIESADLPIEIPDNLGNVTIYLNGHDLVGGDGQPAIRIVSGEGDGSPTQITIVNSGDDATVQGGEGAPAIEVADGVCDGVVVDVGDGVTVKNGYMPPEVTLKVGEYFKMTLAELGYEVPTNGTVYSVTAYGLPAGLQLKYNAAVKDKKGKVIKKAKCEWWIEGVPTAALDFFTNPPYLVIAAGTAAPHAEPLPIEVLAQEVTPLDDLELGQSINTNGWLAGVGAGWTVSGLPTGLKYATKKVTKTTGSGKKKVTTTVAEAYAVYGKTTKAGLFTITAKKKVGAFYETMKYRVLVRPAAVDAAVFGEELTDIVTMAYVPVAWDLTGGGRGATALPAVSNVVKVAGLPTGLTFAAKDVYGYANAKKKTGKYLKQAGQTIVGTPTKPGTYVVTFTKNVKSGKKTVAKTAQILWVVEPNDAKVELGFNTAGGVIEGGSVGLKYGDLMAFSATSNATVTASGLPSGIKLVKVEDGSAGGLALPGQAVWGFEGFTTKAGTYLVTVKATLNGKTVTQRLALEVKGLPAWAKGTYNGPVYATGGQDARSTNGLATVTVSSVGKISGKFQEFGTNWTFTAASYTATVPAVAGRPPYQAMESGTQNACPYQEFICSNVVAKYAYKVTEKVKGKKKTVTKYLERTFNLVVAPAPVVPEVLEVLAGPVRGVVRMEEVRLAEDGSPYQGSAVEAWQNLWGRADYKALGKRLFTSKSGKKTLAYKTFAYEGGGDGVDDGHAGRVPLPEGTTLSLKVTTAGVVTATMSYDTGKTKKDPKTKKTVNVIYTATCQTTVIPTSSADAGKFTGEVPLYFAPSPASKFPGYAGTVTFSE